MWPQKSVMDVDTDPKGRNLKIVECCWVHFSPILQFPSTNPLCFGFVLIYWRIPIKNCEIGEKWTQQHFAIFKLRPFGSVSTSKSDFYDRTIFSWFLSETLVFQFLTGLLKEISKFALERGQDGPNFFFAPKSINIPPGHLLTPSDRPYHCPII